MRIGSGYAGSPRLETSTENQNIIPPRENSFRGYNFYKFTFMNTDPCTVIINDKFEIFLQASQGFSIDETDHPIYKFVIKEPNVTFNWVGAHGI